MHYVFDVIYIHTIFRLSWLYAGTAKRAISKSLRRVTKSFMNLLCDRFQIYINCVYNPSSKHCLGHSEKF